MLRAALDRMPARAVLDGAIGTELLARGLVLGKDCPDAWNLSAPETLRQIYRAYFEAGADAVQTNTFGGTRIRLGACGQTTNVRAINVAGAVLCREVRPAGKLVIGDLGPAGASASQKGDLEDAFAEQAAYLAEAGVDLLHIETLMDPLEARAAVRGARLGAPGLAVVASLTCTKQHGAFVTPLGHKWEAVLDTLLEEKVDGVGTNCSLAPHDMLGLVERMRARTDKVLWAKPTCAPTYGPSVSPAEFARAALALYQAGANAVGGCCGTGPAHIAALAAARVIR
jgi:methionine synthase I (cobalamin-dependent)